MRETEEGVFAVIVDLHAHFPMHVRPAQEPVRFSTEQSQAPLTLDTLADLSHADETLEWLILQAVCSALDYSHGHPCVDAAGLIEGRVGVALSALYWPPDELAPGHIQKPPKSGCFHRLIEQLDAVETELESTSISIARNYAELEAAWNKDKPVVVHAVEGGFALGTTPEEICKNVAILADRGIAYVTLAHLFWLHVAANEPALPFLKDDLFERIFPVPADVGLTELGCAAVQAMAERKILVDVTHMTQLARDKTFEILDKVGGKDKIPVLASHGACRLGNGQDLAYNLDRRAVERIAARNGVIGLLLCDHYMSRGVETSKSGIERSLDIFCAHADCIASWTGSYDVVAIGTDLDGFINPTLPGLEKASKLKDLEKGLYERYSPEIAEKICSGNARTVLKAAWR